MIGEGRVLFPKRKEGRPREKKFLKDLQKEHTGFSTWLESKTVGFTTHGTRDLTELLKGKFFDFPKPVTLIKTLIGQVMQSEDIVFDFFAGSGTTAEAIMELNKQDNGNRKFILAQLPEPTEEASEASKAGYKTIADISKERIRRVINKIKKENVSSKQLGIDLGTDSIGRGITGTDRDSIDFGFKVFKLSPSNFKIWRSDEITEENLVEQLDAFTDPVRGESEESNILYELMLKAGYSLTEKIESKAGYYPIQDGELVIVLTGMNNLY